MALVEAMNMKKMFKSSSLGAGMGSNGKDIGTWIQETQDINIKDDHDMTALMWACKLKYVQVVAMILETRQADCNLQNLAGDTALHIACQQGQIEIVKQLIEIGGANVNVPNDHGNTPLHYACFYKYKDIAKILLNAGALSEATNKYKKSAFAFAGPRLILELELKGIFYFEDQVGTVLIPGRDVSVNQSTIQAKVLKARSREQVEMEAKAKHIAQTRKQLWEMSPSSILLSDLLYKTDTCDYYTGTCGSSNNNNNNGGGGGVKVLVKKLMVQKKKRLEDADMDRLKDTLKPMQSMYHPNLVSMLGVCLDREYVAIAYDLSSGTCNNLQQMLHDDSLVFKPVQILKYALDVCNGLIYLYSQSETNGSGDGKGGGHLNLKTRNIIIVKSGGGEDKACFVDYGLHNTILGHWNDYGDRILEPEWIAPEILKQGVIGDGRDAREQADVYSFGIVFYEMVTRQLAYYSDTVDIGGDGGGGGGRMMNAMLIGLKVLMEGLRPAIPSYVPSQLQDLMRLCWNEQVEKRPRLDVLKLVLEELISIEKEDESSE